MKALCVVAVTNQKRLDGLIFTEEALKAIAEQSPEKYTYDEETGELLMRATYNVGPTWREPHTGIGITYNLTDSPP